MSTTVRLEVDEFAVSARGFLAWCEADHGNEAAAAMRLQMLQHLADIYAAALHLPGGESPPSPEPPRLSVTQRQRITANLRSLPFQYYWEVSTPLDLETDEAVGCGDLFDDCVDICADLAEGLWLYDRQHVAAAAWHWSLSFNGHWGQHAVSAMHALHTFQPPASTHSAG